MATIKIRKLTVKPSYPVIHRFHASTFSLWSHIESSLVAFLDVSYSRENTDYLCLKCILHVILEQTRWEFPRTGGNTRVRVEHKHCLWSQGSMEGSLGWDPWRRTRVLHPHSVAFPFYRASICVAFQRGHNACLSIRQSEVRWQLFRERVCSACCQHLLTWEKLPLDTAPPAGGWGSSGPIQIVARQPKSSGSDSPVCLSTSI